MPTSGPRKATIDKNDLPPAIKLGKDSYGYLTRYRIISEDRNRFSHWSPIFALPAFDSQNLPGQVEGTINIIGDSITVIWDDEIYRPRYDVFIGLGFRIIEKSLLSNKATITTIGNHNLSVGSVVEIFGEENPPDYLDTSFNSNANGDVNSIKTQPDGKILVAGSFTAIGGIARINIARLNKDGTLDTDFVSDGNGTAKSIVIQPDGKIIVGGAFTAINGTTRNHIARLNSDGTLDTSFNPNANSAVDAIALQPDGKIIIGGDFTTVGGTTRNRIARLNSDGTLDTSFNPNASSSISSIALQPDGKILIGGLFTTVGGVSRNYVARLNGNGTLDTSFNPNANSFVFSIAIQQDDKIVIGGIFSLLGGTTRNRIARLNSDGTLDTSFNPNVQGPYVRSILLQSDNTIIIGGQFSNVYGVAVNNFAKLVSRDFSSIFYGTYTIAEINSPNSFSYQKNGDDVVVSLVSGTVSGYFYHGSSLVNTYSFINKEEIVSVSATVQIESIDKEKSEVLTICEVSAIIE